MTLRGLICHHCVVTVEPVTSVLLTVDDRAQLGVLLRRKRLQVGWTQAKLADVSRVPQGKISRIERGESYPPLATISSIGEALGMKVQLNLTDG